jgi:hypothetical protein
MALDDPTPPGRLPRANPTMIIDTRRRQVVALDPERMRVTSAAAIQPAKSPPNKRGGSSSEKAPALHELRSSGVG